jgi:hypothetical protein
LQNVSGSRRGARETDPSAASIWAVNAAIQGGQDDAVDGIVREVVYAQLHLVHE